MSFQGFCRRGWLTSVGVGVVRIVTVCMCLMRYIISELLIQRIGRRLRTAVLPRLTKQAAIDSSRDCAWFSRFLWVIVSFVQTFVLVAKGWLLTDDHRYLRRQTCSHRGRAARTLTSPWGHFTNFAYNFFCITPTCVTSWDIQVALLYNRDVPFWR